MIYVIAEVGDPCGPVKIGYTKGEPFEGGWEDGLKHRLRDIQMGNSRELEVIGLTSGTHKQELALHAAFGRYRAMHEWFYRVGPVLDFVCSIGVDPIRGSSLRHGTAKAHADMSSKAVRSVLGRAWSQVGYELRNKRRQRTRCGSCGTEGHNRRSCSGSLQVPVSSSATANH